MAPQPPIPREFAIATFAQLYADMERWSRHLNLEKTPDITLMVGHGDDIHADAWKDKTGQIKRVIVIGDNILRMYHDKKLSYGEFSALASHEFGHHVGGHVLVRNDLSFGEDLDAHLNTPKQRDQEFAADKIAACLTNKDDLMNAVQKIKDQNLDLNATDFTMNYLGLGYVFGHVGLGERKDNLAKSVCPPYLKR